MTAKTFFNKASWAILFFLFIPAGAVQASKDAMPGEQMYPIKLILEDALLLIMKPSSAVTSDMEMKFTKRRLLEVEHVADTPLAIKSLKSLNEQVVNTTTSISKVKNLNKQSKLVNEYIQTLQETRTTLAQQQTTAANLVNNKNTTIPNQIENGFDLGSPSTNGNDVSTQTEIQQQLEETQAEITAEIEKLEQVASENEQLQRQQQTEAANKEAKKQEQKQHKASQQNEKKEPEKIKTQDKNTEKIKEQVQDTLEEQQSNFVQLNDRVNKHEVKDKD